MKSITNVLVLTIAIAAVPGACRSTEDPPAPADPAPSADEPTAEPDAFSFTAWRELTNGPRTLYTAKAQFLYFMCSDPTPHIERVYREEFGPHALRQTRVFVNPLASAAIDSERPWRFAEGAVIVKQKLARVAAASALPGTTAYRPAQGGDPGETTGVGVMIKREPGYAPDDGDWQYLYSEPGAEPVVDPVAARNLPSLNNCATCHNQAARQDRAYLPYLEESSPAK